MSKWICKYCGEDTSGVDMDYLVGTDHLVCILFEEDDKPLKIENWEKLDGNKFVCEGVTLEFTNPVVVDDRYTVQIYQPMNPNKLTLFVRVDFWSNHKELSVKVFPPDHFKSVPIHLETKVMREQLKTKSEFVKTLTKLLKSDKSVRQFLEYIKNEKMSKNGTTGTINAGTFIPTFASASFIL